MLRDLSLHLLTTAIVGARVEDAGGHDETMEEECIRKENCMLLLQRSVRHTRQYKRLMAMGQMQMDPPGIDMEAAEVTYTAALEVRVGGGGEEEERRRRRRSSRRSSFWRSLSGT
jgi:hypothetical protein